jgi:hypothetical protein
VHTFTGPITAHGPMIEVLVGLATADVQTLLASGRPVPPPVRATAVIDTGAETTAFDPVALSALRTAGIPPARILTTHAPALGGTRPASEYAISLTVVHPSGTSRANLTLRALTILEVPLGVLGYQALIGRDVLARCLLIYDSPAGTFTLAY